MKQQQQHGHIDYRYWVNQLRNSSCFVLLKNQFAAVFAVDSGSFASTRIFDFLSSFLFSSMSDLQNRKAS